ncbi:MAG: hypothetical protein KDI79_16720 [Anaerolineae bacterium]|nr:hypothetical protein [Anaerolineae bacterium]
MSNQVVVNPQTEVTIKNGDWVKLGINTAIVSIIAVLIVQALAIAIWPEIALFAPLDSYIRSAIFTLVPVIGATALLAWLVAKQTQPVKKFITISVVILIISFIPDYILPVEYKTVLASSVAAFLHVVAAVVAVPMLVIGYQRQANRTM